MNNDIYFGKCALKCSERPGLHFLLSPLDKKQKVEIYGHINLLSIIGVDNKKQVFSAFHDTQETKGLQRINLYYINFWLLGSLGE